MCSPHVLVHLFIHLFIHPSTIYWSSVCSASNVPGAVLGTRDMEGDGGVVKHTGRVPVVVTSAA